MNKIIREKRRLLLELIICFLVSGCHWLYIIKPENFLQVFGESGNVSQKCVCHDGAPKVSLTNSYPVLLARIIA